MVTLSEILTAKKPKYTCLDVAIAALFSPLIAISQGFMLLVVYTWFVQPFFHLPDVPIAAWAGLSFALGALFEGFFPVYTEDEATMIERRIVSFCMPFFYAGTLWIVHLFVTYPK